LIRQGTSPSTTSKPRESGAFFTQWALLPSFWYSNRSKNMYYIYTDEAGTSAPEPWTIVVAVVVKDNLRESIIERMDKLKDEFVPACFRTGFVSHGKEIFNDTKRKYRSCWSPADRTEFLRRLMALPSETLGMGFAWAAVSRSCDLPPIDVDGRIVKRRDKVQHAYAFAYCMSRADRIVRRLGNDSASAQIIAEDVDGSSLLQRAVGSLRRAPHFLPIEWAINPEHELVDGELPKSIEVGIRRIEGKPDFREKGVDPILEVADACAFGFRRYAEGRTFGEDFIRAIYGGRDPAGRVNLITGFHAANAFCTEVREPTSAAPIPIFSYSVDLVCRYF
jgi:hypothetical protein